jgi:hypothetical protein
MIRKLTLSMSALALLAFAPASFAAPEKAEKDPVINYLRAAFTAAAVPTADQIAALGAKIDGESTEWECVITAAIRDIVKSDSTSSKYEFSSIGAGMLYNDDNDSDYLSAKYYAPTEYGLAGVLKTDLPDGLPETSDEPELVFQDTIRISAAGDLISETSVSEADFDKLGLTSELGDPSLVRQGYRSVAYSVCKAVERAKPEPQPVNPEPVNP